jgi:hypothetical protein
LPPSITRSPGLSASASCRTVCLVGSPEGTITHTVRGGVSAAARWASDFVSVTSGRGS